MDVLCWPAAQGVQELARAPLYVPAPQGVQELAPSLLYVPAAQFEQEVSAFHPALYVPAAPAQAISAMSPIRQGRQSGGFEKARPVRSEPQCDRNQHARETSS